MHLFASSISQFSVVVILLLHFPANKPVEDGGERKVARIPPKCLSNHRYRPRRCHLSRHSARSPRFPSLPPARSWRRTRSIELVLAPETCHSQHCHVVVWSMILFKDTSLSSDSAADTSSSPTSQPPPSPPFPPSKINTPPPSNRSTGPSPFPPWVSPSVR